MGYLRVGMVGLMVSVSVAPTYAQTAPAFKFDTVQDLRSLCLANHPAPFRVFCMAYIEGSVETRMAFGGYMMTLPPIAGLGKIIAICPKGPVTRAAGAKIFENWANAHPEKWGESPIEGVIEAFSAAYPCGPAK